MSLQPQQVSLCGESIPFEEGETVHTENSHKYTVEGFWALASQAGFAPRRSWCDKNGLFSVHWLECG